jgi:hypothetical protein
MLTIILAIIAGYIAIGVAVVVTLNYAEVNPKNRLGSIREGVPLVLQWPIVVYIVWALRK